MTLSYLVIDFFDNSFNYNKVMGTSLKLQYLNSYASIYYSDNLCLDKFFLILILLNVLVFFLYFKVKIILFRKNKSLKLNQLMLTLLNY